MLLAKLVQIGFNVTEAKIYLELLRIGPQGVSVLAGRIGLNRCTIYSTLRTLEKKGIVSSYRNGGVKFFAPNDPSSLVAYLDRQCRTFDYYKTDLLTVLPEFRTLTDVKNFRKPVLSYFDGIEGVRHVMHDVLSADKGDVLAYLCGDEWFEEDVKNFLLYYRDLRVEQKKLFLKAMASDTAVLRTFFGKHYAFEEPMTEILYVGKDIAPDIFRDEMMIYGDKVAIVHLDRGSEYGVVIESKEIASMQRSVFEMAWAVLSTHGEVKMY